MRGSRKFCQRGPIFMGFRERRDDLNKTQYKRAIIDPPAKRYLAFRWRADNGPKLHAGLVAL